MEGNTDEIESYTMAMEIAFQSDVINGLWVIQYPTNIVIPTNPMPEVCDVADLRTELIQTLNGN